MSSVVSFIKVWELYQGVGALSRKDNGTEICSKCGQAEGMEELMNYFFTLMDE